MKPREAADLIGEALRDLQSAALASAIADQTDYGDSKRTRKTRRRLLLQLQAASKKYHEAVMAMSFSAVTRQPRTL